MKKYIFIIILLTCAFSFQRPSAYNFSNDSKTAFWGSIITPYDSFSAPIYNSWGFDFPLCKNVEISIDLKKNVNNKLISSVKYFNLNYWFHKSFAVYYTKQYGQEITTDRPTIGIKGFNDSNYWVSFNMVVDKDATFNKGIYIFGKLWKINSNLLLNLSYHFEPENYDKGDILFSIGRSL